MTQFETAASAASTPRGLLADIIDEGRRILKWPWAAKLFAAGVLLLYAPIVVETSRTWREDDRHAHGFLIIPLSLLLAWGIRQDLRQAKHAPTAWGLVPLTIGLFLECVAYIARVKFIPMASLTLVLMGGILLLHGKNLWKASAFIVLFLLFAAPMPDVVIQPVSAQIQSASTTCAAELMKSLGYPLVQTGNRIDTPTVSVEVAEVCSGFKKLTVLAAFSLLYGYVFALSPRKRLILFLAAYPVALICNSIRIAALVGIGTTWGVRALETAHDSAEFAVLLMASVLFLFVGRLLGCKATRFSQ